MEHVTSSSCGAAFTVLQGKETSRREPSILLPIVIEKSLDGRVTAWSEGAEIVFGYAPGEIIGRHVSLIIPFEYQDEEYEMTDRMRADKMLQSCRTLRRTRVGVYFMLDLLASPIFDASGKIIGTRQCFSNIEYLGI